MGAAAVGLACEVKSGRLFQRMAYAVGEQGYSTTLIGHMLLQILLTLASKATSIFVEAATEKPDHVLS
jgi:hypothetical protein